VGYLVFLVIAVVSWAGLDQIAARFAQMDPTSIHERPAIWAATIRIAEYFWLTGTGLNTRRQHLVLPDRGLRSAPA